MLNKILDISMAERNTDVTTFSKTFQEKQKTFPCDPHDWFQIARLYIDVHRMLETTKKTF